MVTLPGLETYSSEQIQKVHEASRAFTHYERFVPNLIDPVGFHQQRHQAWMKAAAATILESAATETICRFWSDTADEILKRAWSHFQLDQFPAALFALGKLGAQELNLSSDIDLLVVCEPSVAREVERKFRKFRKCLHHSRDLGLCFRLDFDLRPGGRMGPLLTSPDQFEDYYWSQGETWERLALIRLRAICGDQELIRRIEDLARRFSFRKYLDFTLLEDLKSLRSQVHQFGFQRQNNQIHIKLEVGGIRDIELFVHSLQILNGGKLAELRIHSTGLAIERLRDAGLMERADADRLLESYWWFRHIENRVQAQDDRQTHFVGINEYPDLTARMNEVNRIVTDLLGEPVPASPRLPADQAAQKKWLKKLGYSQESIQETWPRLISATVLSHKNDRDERARQELLYVFVEELAKQARFDQDLGLKVLEDFVRSTRAKATFFTMLLRTPGLIQDLARLFSLSPYLSTILVARPELLDHFILRTDDPWSTEMETLLQQMNDRKLLNEIWSANRFVADHDLNGLFDRSTETADEICRQLLLQLKTEFPASSLEIIALGKWGGRELGLRSDLDFIFVCPKSPVEDDFKVARRFVSRLTDPQKFGHLFEVDLRLRPSGHGALLIGLENLHSFWRDQAQAWERQAYLRSRPLDPAIHLDKSLLFERPITERDREELKTIREKLLKRNANDVIDLKYAPGGLLDIEFVCQIAFLDLGASLARDDFANTDVMISRLEQLDQNWRSTGARLRDLYQRQRLFEQMLQLAAERKQNTMQKGKPVFERTARLLSMDPDDAWLEIQNLQSQSCRLLNSLDPTGFHRS